METVDLIAPDISCEHCKHAIEGSLSKVGGVDNVNVDIPSKTVHVAYNTQQVTLSKLEEVLDDIGYTIQK